MPGCDARVYFNPDVPGRALQMQQILSKAGIPYMLISRYHEGLYRWLSPDGSSVLAYSPGHYGNAAAILNAPVAEAVLKLKDKLTQWNPYYEKRHLPAEFPLLNSVDFSKPTDFGPLIKAWNEGHSSEGKGSRMDYSSARGFFESVDGRGARFDEVLGERPNLWLYIHGPTHHWAISAQRQAGMLLPAAEVFSTALALLEGSFKSYPARELEEAWMASIYPDHGWGGKEGQITDRLFRKKYEFARDTGQAVLDRALKAIAGRVETAASSGIPIVVFNGLSWARTDIIESLVPSHDRSLAIFDAKGNEVTSQILPPLPGQDPGQVRLRFLAADVPPLGYKTFYAFFSAAGGAARDAEEKPAGTNFENRYYRITFAPGGIKSIFDKELGRELIDSSKFLGFEVFTLRSVGNGAGEFGRVTRLGTFFPMPKAERVNIIEEEGRPIASGPEGLELKVGHNAIETVKLRPDTERKH
jgi:alpha-mannosidase